MTSLTFLAQFGASGQAFRRRPTERDDMLTVLNENGTTIVMVTHSSAYAEYGHRVIHLFDGGVVTENIKEKFSV